MMFTWSSVLASLKKFREEEFECPVWLEPLCTDTLINPESNHRFCGKCIKESLRKCNHECPTCRVHIPSYRTCRRDPQFDHILDRLVKEYIVPLEKQISNEQGEKQVPEKETQEIVGQKRRARTCTGTSSTSASKKMIAAGGTRRSKRVKVAHTRYVPVEEVSYWPSSHYAFSGVVKMHPTLTASPPLDNIRATAETTVMIGINEDGNTSSTRRVLAVAATTRVTQRRKCYMSFDERFKDLMAFKAEFGHCNVPQTYSRNNKHSSLGKWCNNIRQSFKAIKEGRRPGYKLSKAGIEWGFRRKKCTFD